MNEYLAALAKAQSLPYHYRTGVEARARRIWNALTEDERNAIRALYDETDTHPRAIGGSR